MHSTDSEKKISDNLLSLACDGVQGLKPYEAGKPIEELEREYGVSNVVKLASNENPLGTSKKVRDAVESCINGIALYPDGNAFYLKAAIAEHLSSTGQSIHSENITIGNGSNDVLEIIAHCFADHCFAGHKAEVIYSQHAFAVYPIVTQAVGAKHVVTPAKDWGHDLDAMVNAITHKTRLIFIANPNNPTGTWLDAETLRAFLSKVPESVIVVVDEAYHEYLDHPDYASAVNWINEFPNLIVTRTFSKAYGLAGLRIGYGISHSVVADILNRVRQPFNANSFALAAAQAALSDADFLNESVKVNKEGMHQLTAAFEKMSLDYIPSVGNFVCVDVKFSGNVIYEALLKKGVIVRPVTPYQMPNFIRVSVGSQAENAIFIASLSEVLSEMSFNSELAAP